MMTVHEAKNDRESILVTAGVSNNYQNDHAELQFTFCTHHDETSHVNTLTMHINIPDSWILLDN